MSYDFENNLSYILKNPREVSHLEECQFPSNGEFLGHFWLLTSGSSGQRKWVALSKQAFLSSAKSVVEVFSINRSDCWLHALPDFHVGGLSIWARSWITGSSVIQLSAKWDPLSFASSIEKNRATLTSLVPAQIFDLVQQGIRPYHSLRLVFVGGGRLDKELKKRAKSLGWPLEITYGMTECSSQVATSRGADQVVPLPHVELKTDSDGLLMIKSPALLSTYAYEKEGKLDLKDPKVDEWFKTEDVVLLKDDSLEIVGRKGDFFKVLGENVVFSSLEVILEAIKPSYGDVAILPIPCQRRGIAITLCYSGLQKHEVDALIYRFNDQVRPFERIIAVNQREKLVRSPLGKLLREENIRSLHSENQGVTTK